MNQIEHSDHNLSLALKGFSFSFEECRPYTAIRHLIHGKQLWWVSRMPIIAQPQTWCKGCAVKTLSIHTPRNFILFHRRQMLHLYSFGGSLERNNVYPWWTLAFIIPEKTDAHICTAYTHACIHVCSELTSISLVCLVKLTIFLSHLSIYCLHILLFLHPVLIALSLSFYSTQGNISCLLAISPSVTYKIWRSVLSMCSCLVLGLSASAQQAILMPLKEKPSSLMSYTHLLLPSNPHFPMHSKITASIFLEKSWTFSAPCHPPPPFCTWIVWLEL